MSVGDSAIDVRSFTMANDPDSSIGHPALFVEHAVYQSPFEHRESKCELTKNRLRKIFGTEAKEANTEIRWDSKSQLLGSSRPSAYLACGTIR